MHMNMNIGQHETLRYLSLSAVICDEPIHILHVIFTLSTEHIIFIFFEE